MNQNQHDICHSNKRRKVDQAAQNTSGSNGCINVDISTFEDIDSLEDIDGLEKIIALEEAIAFEETGAFDDINVSELNSSTYSTDPPLNIPKHVISPQHQSVLDRRQTFISSPIQLTHIEGFPTANNVDTISLRNILRGPDIKECWAFNFFIDVEFLM